MGNSGSASNQKNLKNVLPVTDEQKRKMKRPHIVKPCPDM
jgi:hypothetical protein